MSLKKKKEFYAINTNIFYTQNLVMQLPFDSNTLSDDGKDLLDFISGEKVYFNLPILSSFECLLLVTYFCDLWTLW